MSKYTDNDIEKMLGELERELAPVLAKAQDEHTSSLSKSEPAPIAKAEDKPAEEKKEEPKAEDKKEEPKAADAKKDDDCDYDDEDKEEMHKMYLSMSKAELGLHREACEKAHVSKCGEMSMGKSEAAAEDKKPEAKAEEKASEEPLLKAEIEKKAAEIADLKKSNDDLKKTVDLVTQVLSKLGKRAPQAKAITEIGFIKKSEDGTEEKPAFSKAEVTAALNRKAQDPSLSKADREKINQFCLAGAPVESVKHLLDAGSRN